jgi:hypothetical protein
MNTSRNFPGFVSVTGAWQHNVKNLNVGKVFACFSEVCMPRRNAGTWIQWRLLRGASSSKSAFRKWTASTVCRLR